MTCGYRTNVFKFYNLKDEIVTTLDQTVVSCTYYKNSYIYRLNVKTRNKHMWLGSVFSTNSKKKNHKYYGLTFLIDRIYIAYNIGARQLKNCVTLNISNILLL